MAKSIHVFILVLLLHVIESTLANKFSSLSHPDECSLLFQFKESISINSSASFDSRAYPKVALWNLNTSNCCLWDGAECRFGHVIGLDLSSSFLYGPISSNNTLFNLIHLRTLNLADNDFSQIPSGIGRLSQLANLNLSHSGFSGEVPKQISQLINLVSLDLTGNYELKLQSSDFQNLVQNSSETLRELFLSWVNIDSVPNSLPNSSLLTSLVMGYCGLGGEFPTGIFNLQTLQLLDVQGNDNLTGYIPEFHGNSELKQLIVAETKFQGSIPASIGNLIHLNNLDLSKCAFTGTIPTSVSNLTKLTVLDLGYNFFSGPIPSGVFNLQLLQFLDVQANHNLTGYIPEIHGNSELKQLIVAETKFQGSIPASIGNLTRLNILDLSNCAFTGTLPAFVSNLTQLTNLDLSDNKFTGNLPSLERFLNLTDLDLSGNNMIGEIPSSLRELTRLTTLDLSRNNFDRWKLPEWFGKLNKITVLYLHDVNLFGEIPSSFFNLTQVVWLDLSRNQLKGKLSSSLLNFQNLESFYLYDNNVTVDFYLFLSLKKLKVLDLSGNNITLPVRASHTNQSQQQFIYLQLASCNLTVFPEFLQFQHQLESLYLDNNNIEGLIPSWMWNISKEKLTILSLSQNLLSGFEHYSPVASWVSLETLDLSHNMLHGSIPVLQLPTTLYFSVSNNKLIGEIPQSICNMFFLQFLDLAFNNVTGSIPPCLEKLNSMVVLNLRSNNLQGTIPNIFSNMGGLQMIDLSENKLEGKLPRSLENCGMLQFLNVGYNFIEDMFPFWLGALSDLQVLILRANKFHGIIRIQGKSKVNFPKLRIIDLSYNSFYGDLPHRYFWEWSAMKETTVNATYMETIFLGEHWSLIQMTNKGVMADYVMVIKSFSPALKEYWFSIQMTNKGLKADYAKMLNSFSAVDLSSNMFRGKIPESIKTLRGLQLLNLSNNELSGVIPPSMGNLIHLEALDLSNNKLSGMIPQDLVQLNFLAVLNVSNNNLTGPIPQGKQFNTFSNNSYMENQALCGFPLSMKCGDSKASKPPKDSSDFPNGIDWVVILIGGVSGLVIGIVCGDQLTTRYSNWFLQRFRN